jgi:transcriptional regulator with XRE-family HTH domain
MLNERIKMAREALKLSQVEAAELSGIPVGTLRKYEQGPSKPGADAVSGLVRIGVNANWLMTGEGEMLLQGAFAPAAQGAAVYNRENVAAQGQAQHPAAPASVISRIDGALLRLCWGACGEVHGEPFQAASPFLQLEHAVELYNLLHDLTAGSGKPGLEEFARLDRVDLAQQLRIFIKMGRARRFVPGTPVPGTEPWAW